MTDAFLKDIAQSVYDRYASHLGEVLMIFPNRRAGKFFQHYLSEHLTGPSWSPQVLSLEDFVRQFDQRTELDKIRLLYLLYQSFCRVLQTEEPFEDFFFWGELLLSDFDEVDRHLVPAKNLYANLAKVKELDASFDFLSEQEKNAVMNFWQAMDRKPSQEQDRFLKLWTNLFEVYSQFRTDLQDKGWTYKGMIYQQALEKLQQDNNSLGTVILAGFNALTKSEEQIIRVLIESYQAEIFWDVDQKYLDDKVHQAGNFLRRYRYMNLFEKSIREQQGNRLSRGKQVQVYALAGKHAQAYWLGQQLEELARSGFDPTKTVVVLPDEQLLIPVLNAIPRSVDKVNVTMGYPVKNTSLYALLENVVGLWSRVSAGGTGTYLPYGQLQPVLNHPMIRQLAEKDIRKQIKEWNEKNRKWIEHGQIELKGEIFDVLLLPPQQARDGIRRLSQLVVRLSSSSGNTSGPFQKEVFYTTYRQLNQLSDALNEQHVELTFDGLKTIFRKLMTGVKIPFTGEPLNGLQVMGVLETRSLDFENVFILSMNEEVFPATNRNHSFIPFNIRKAYGLPTFDQQDSIYSYLFYRLLQRAKHITLMYASPSPGEQIGEKSRFIQQLEADPDFEVVETPVVNEVQIMAAKAITYERDEETTHKLNHFLAEANQEPYKKLSPSAVNTYLHCRLQFYFRYIKGLKEYDELTEEVDARQFGNLLHKVMEEIYVHHQNLKDGREVKPADIVNLRSWLDEAVDRAFRQEFHLGQSEPVDYSGRNVIIRELISRYAARMLEHDEAHAPFKIIGLEANASDGYELNLPLGGQGRSVRLRGIIDRMDEKSGVARVLDYKSGGDETVFPSLESLVDRKNDKRNKAVFQVLWYSLIFHNRFPEWAGGIQPAIFNSKQLFSSTFDWRIKQGSGKKVIPVDDARPLLGEYRELLKGLLEELFFSDLPFSQTDDVSKCQYCPYRGICHR
jgi:hypothetical protein